MPINLQEVEDAFPNYTISVGELHAKGSEESLGPVVRFVAKENSTLIRMVHLPARMPAHQVVQALKKELGIAN